MNFEISNFLKAYIVVEVKFHIIFSNMSNKVHFKKIEALSDEDVQKLQKKFDKWDKDHNGYLDQQEISNFMGKSIGDASLPGLAVRIFDQNGDGKIQFQEFVQFYQALKQINKDQFILYKMLFDAIDRDHKGYLTEEEMYQFFPYVIQDGQTSKSIIEDFNKNGFLDKNGTRLTKESLLRFFES